MENVLIHVGFTKTASTFLQNQIFRKLSDTSTLLPPETYWNPVFQDLVYSDNSLFNKDALRNYAGQITNRNTIISSEAFCGIYNQAGINRSQIANRLKSVFPKAKILIVIRSQREMVRAHYSQYIMSHLTHGIKTLEDFFHYSSEDSNFWESHNWRERKLMYLPNQLSLNSRFLTYYSFIELYMSLFDKVKVVLFEDLVSNTNSSVKEICDFAEINEPQRCIDSFKKENASKNLKDLVIERKSNIISKIVSNTSIVQSTRLMLKYLDPSISREVRKMEDILDSINMLYRSNNQKILEDFGIRLDQHPDYYSL